MTRRRWIADEVSGSRAVLTGVHADHLTRVLRARIGQEFDIATGSRVRTGRITAIEQGRVEFELGEDVVTEVVTPGVTVALSIFKFDPMEWAIEKCTELGAARIIPVVARRTDPHLASAAVKRADRWRRIAHEAAEQSRRAAVPDIPQPMELKDVLILPGSARIVLSEVESKVMLTDALPSPLPADLILAFGPEGGWAESELDQFQGAGWKSASLGGTILRAETAAIAALAVLMSHLRR